MKLKIKMPGQTSIENVLKSWELDDIEGSMQAHVFKKNKGSVKHPYGYNVILDSRTNQIEDFVEAVVDQMDELSTKRISLDTLIKGRVNTCPLLFVPIWFRKDADRYFYEYPTKSHVWEALQQLEVKPTTILSVNQQIFAVYRIADPRTFAPDDREGYEKYIQAFLKAMKKQIHYKGRIKIAAQSLSGFYAYDIPTPNGFLPLPFTEFMKTRTRRKETVEVLYHTDEWVLEREIFPEGVKL